MSSQGPGAPGPGPILDLRVRWRLGQVALAFAVLFAAAALLRPLAPGTSPLLRAAVALGLGLGLGASALLASLKGRSRAEQAAFYLFLALALDGLGQLLASRGVPAWPLPVLLVAAVAVAEPVPWALAAAALFSALAGAEASRQAGPLPPVAATSLAYAALALAVNRGLALEKRRLRRAEHEVARLKSGLDPVDEAGPRALTTTAMSLRQVSEPGRRARQRDRAQELYAVVDRLVVVARAALGAHAVTYFEVDHERGTACQRSGAGPESLLRDAVVGLPADPFAFVVERRQPFYATDFPRLLGELPYYRERVAVGSLLAVPVWAEGAAAGGVVAGVLVADRLEIQSFGGSEPALLQAFADLAGEMILRTRQSLAREEMGAEFKAIHAVSRNLATLIEAAPVRGRLLQAARDLVPAEAAAVVVCDEGRTRYVVEEAEGWAREFVGREVGITEKTWVGWVLRGDGDPYMLDSVSSQRDRTPLLVLDEPAGVAESLLAVPLVAGDEALGALLLTGRKGAFDAAAQRILGILANQAAAALSNVRLLERIAGMAMHDGLTGLHNRRAFDEALLNTVSREKRQGGRFALVILDVDHFKKLNDSFGHPAGDAALRNTAQVLERHLRRGDQAARYGGEEFAAILPGSDEAGAVQLAERVRQALERSHVVFEGARLSVTASFGVACWQGEVEAAEAPEAPEPPAERALDQAALRARLSAQAEALTAAADQALYAAKAGGRNRVVAASTLAAGPGA